MSLVICSICLTLSLIAIQGKTSMFAMQNVFVDPSKAIEELGLPQTPIETAIEDAVKWFRDNNYV